MMRRRLVKNATTQYQQQQHRCNKDQVSLCSFLSLFLHQSSLFLLLLNL